MIELKRGQPALAVIPARGGSKRLPRKNVADFFGHPVVSYTIRAALEAGCFGRVVLSTEDAEIANIGRRYGAEVDARPTTLASDFATVADVCLELLQRESEAGREYVSLCALYATAPLRGAEDIRATMALLDPDLCDFAFAVTTYDLPPYRALRKNADDTLTPMWPELASINSRDMPALYVNNGSTFAVSVSAFRKHRDFIGPGAKGYFMPRARSTDMDVPDDLEEARRKAERLGWHMQH
jgi:pseudaminic acid cytidylyltransferase